MKTRTTRVTLTNNSISDSDCFDIEITDEGGEYLVVSCGINGSSISIDPSEWPFLRDAIDRMFVEIAEAHVEPVIASQGATDDDGWITWNGGVCPVPGNTRVLVRYRGGDEDLDRDFAYLWRWPHFQDISDIIAYKVVG